MYCPALYPPENGAISRTGDVEYGGSVTFTCHPGYELVGSPIRRCITNETVEQVWWSGTHTTCEGIVFLGYIAAGSISRFFKCAKLKMCKQMIN